MRIGKPGFFFTMTFFACTGILLPSCDKNNEFTMGEDFIESSVSLSIVDTFMVDMSTVIQDSVTTSGKGAMLIGHYQDTLFGNTSCSGYFQIGLPENISLDKSDIYDSIALIIQYSGYSYGDTNSLMAISVHRLTDSIKLHNNGYLYNVSSVKFDDNPLGSATFRPSPQLTDASVSIPLKNAFGLDLFNQFIEQTETITDINEFLRYFKGIAILADEAASKTIIGFLAVEGSPYIRLYTHRIDQTTTANHYDFPLINTDYQFNQIQYDLSHTVLNYTDNEKTAIPSGVAGNKAFVQGYQKILTKLRFPTLPSIFLNERGVILKAELVFYPEKSSYYDFDLPDYLILYETNRHNKLLNIIMKDQENPLTATLVADYMYHVETSYTFDITDFITAEYSDAYFDVEHGLLISILDRSFQLNLERIVIEAKNPAPKLRIYYMTY